MESQETVLKEAIAYVNQVKLMFRDRKEDYKKFLKVLQSFETDPGSHHESIASLFRDHSYFLREFEEFLSDSKPSPRFKLLCESQLFSRVSNKGREFFKKVREKLGTEQFSQFLEIIHYCWTEHLDRNQARNAFASLIGNFPELMHDYEQFWEECEKVKASLPSIKRKRSSCGDEPEPEPDGPDLCNTQRCTPSYRKRTTLSPMRASKRSKLDDQVLNDQWECKPLKVSGEFSHRHIKDSKEKLEFDLEDTRYELDMVLSRLRTAADSADELLQKIKNDINFQTPIQLQDHFSPLSLRCIEQMYAEHGPDVNRALKNDPAKALPVILRRLSQKKEEAMMALSQFNQTTRRLHS